MVPEPKSGGGLMEIPCCNFKNINLRDYDKKVLGRLAKKNW